MNSKIGVIGLGFVGGAMYTSFLNKGVNKDNLSGYDKFKNGGIGSFEQMLKTDILFMALPTVYNVKLCKYTQISVKCDEIHPTLGSNDGDDAKTTKSLLNAVEYKQITVNGMEISFHEWFPKLGWGVTRPFLDQPIILRIQAVTFMYIILDFIREAVLDVN